jgi:hypothetical protein
MILFVLKDPLAEMRRQAGVEGGTDPGWVGGGREGKTPTFP